jgi:lyso-ornithine lipid O-acyltransferase
LRGLWKTAVLVGSLCQCIISFLPLRMRGNPSVAERAEWLHRCCKLVLRRMGFGHRYHGELPTNGLIASNHLSYFDILFFGATVPCVFVSKAEVRQWPLLGLLAALGGTVFLDRSSAASAAEAVAIIQELLDAGVLVLVFPEGTSSDGAEVLRFHASLFEPAVRVGAPVAAAAIRYSAGAGATEKDLCYYGDISFAPHLFETLQLPKIAATLQFASTDVFDDRKRAAAQIHESVVELRASKP